MGKRHPDFPAWQWRVSPQDQRDAYQSVLRLIALPLFVVAFLLLAWGVFSTDLPSIAIGMIGLLAGVGLQRGHLL